MIVNVDVKNLEGFTAAELSNDEVMKEELRNKLDMHANNQARFKLPDRVTAKRFVFKLLYGATAYGYFTDSDFLEVGYSQKRWQQVIDEFYNKYQGIAKWHVGLQHEVQKKGHITIPSGRYYAFAPAAGFRGELKWPVTQIKNYPVQGFGADLVKLARIEAWRNIRVAKLEAKFIQTIHDSLVYDCPDEEVGEVVSILRNAVEAIPRLCKEAFNYPFSLPMFCEVAVGPNKNSLVEVA